MPTMQVVAVVCALASVAVGQAAAEAGKDHADPDFRSELLMAHSGARTAGHNQFMTLNLFSNATLTKHNAVCNDGTPSGYYMSRSLTNSTKWMVYLEGGGLCYDLHTCKKRPELLISSSTWPKNLSAPGMFSVNRTTNLFSDFNKIVVIYCTSDLYSGTADKSADPLLDYHFQGKQVVPALLYELAADFDKASEVLLTGGSAGGVGTFMNYEFVKSALSHAHVRALPDAGWFLTTMPTYSKDAVPVATQIEKGWKLWKGAPPARCADALGSKAWQCYSGPFIYPFVPAPASDIMVLKAQTDAWTVNNDGVKMPPDAKELVWLTELAAATRATLVADHVLNVFSANCIYHTSLQSIWDTLSIVDITLSEAVQSWYFENKTTSLIDTCTAPMCNPTCL